jgi:hypothetical protein
MKTKSQTKRILSDLLRGWSITPLQALSRYGCLRLGGRIHDLRKLGYDIATKIITTNGGKRIASYRLAKQGRRLVSVL